LSLAGTTNLSEDERKRLELKIHESPEKIRFSEIRFYLNCWICNKKIYLNELPKGQEPPYLVIDRQKNFLCSLCFSMIRLVKDKSKRR